MLFFNSYTVRCYVLKMTNCRIICFHMLMELCIRINNVARLVSQHGLGYVHRNTCMRFL